MKYIKLTAGERMELFFIELKWGHALTFVAETISSCGIKGNEAGEALRRLALSGQSVDMINYKNLARIFKW